MYAAHHLNWLIWDKSSYLVRNIALYLFSQDIVGSLLRLKPILTIFNPDKYKIIGEIQCQIDFFGFAEPPEETEIQGRIYETENVFFK